MYPDMDKPYEMLAFIYLEKEDFEKALTYADKCNSCNPKNMFA